jgi:hypothetical protein
MSHLTEMKAVSTAVGARMAKSANLNTAICELIELYFEEREIEGALLFRHWKECTLRLSTLFDRAYRKAFSFEKLISDL